MADEPTIADVLERLDGLRTLLDGRLRGLETGQQGIRMRMNDLETSLLRAIGDNHEETSRAVASLRQSLLLLEAEAS